MDPDMKRSFALVTKSTSHLMAPSEIEELRGMVIRNDHAGPGVSLSILNKAENGHILTSPEAIAVAKSISKKELGEPWFHLFKTYSEEESRFNIGVRDPSACGRLNYKKDPSSCVCGGGNCPECSACPYNVSHVGGRSRQGFQFKSLPPMKPEECTACNGDPKP
jgi:hypothetical protein